MISNELRQRRRNKTTLICIRKVPREKNSIVSRKKKKSLRAKLFISIASGLLLEKINIS